MRARGFALGLAAHGIGTARAFQVNAEAGAFAEPCLRACTAAGRAFVFPAVYFAYPCPGCAIDESLSELFSAAILLLLVLDPFGNLPLVVRTLRARSRERRAAVVLRECLFAYVLLLAFMSGGRTFMQLVHLSDVSLSIAGGIILFLIAMRMVFPTRKASSATRAAASRSSCRSRFPRSPGPRPWRR